MAYDKYADILHRRKPLFCMASRLPKCDFAAMDSTTHKLHVGYNLRVAIEALGLTQAEVGRKFGVSPSKLGNWLRGENYPDEWFVYRFCNRYPITADWLYLGRVSGLSGPLGDALYVAALASPAALPVVAPQAGETTEL